MDWRFWIIVFDIIVIILIIEKPWNRVRGSKRAGPLFIAMLFVAMLIISAIAAFVHY